MYPKALNMNGFFCLGSLFKMISCSHKVIKWTGTSWTCPFPEKFGFGGILGLRPLHKTLKKRYIKIPLCQSEGQSTQSYFDSRSRHFDEHPGCHVVSTSDMRASDVRSDVANEFGARSFSENRMLLPRKAWKGLESIVAQNGTVGSSWNPFVPIKLNRGGQ